MEMPAAYREFRGREIVVDVTPPVVYIGRLEAVDETFLLLADVDVHDLRDSPVSKEVYIMEAREHGIRPSRRRVAVKQCEVLSLSLLDDIIVY